MRPPNSAHDPSMYKEEPLRSFFTSVDLSGDEEFREKQRQVVLVLKKEGNIEAVRTWLDFAFPAQSAPHGKHIDSDDEALTVFVQFHWLFRKKGNGTESRPFLERERVKRGWPRKVNDAKLEMNEASTNKPESIRLNKHVETGNAPEQKPIIPTTSHVKNNKYSGLHFPRKADEGSKSGNLARDENPCLTQSLLPSPISKETISSSQNMEKEEPYSAPDSRASTALSECDGEWSETYRAFETDITIGVPTDVTAPAPKNILSEGEAMKTKPIVALGRKGGSRSHNGEKRESARLKNRDSLIKQPSISKSTIARHGSAHKKVATPKQKTGPNDAISTGSESSMAESLPIEKVPCHLLASQSVPCNSLGATNAHPSFHGQEQWLNSCVPVKTKTSVKQSSRNPSTSTSVGKPSLSSNKRDPAMPFYLQPATFPVQKRSPTELESKPRRDEHSDTRQLRSRKFDSSGNPTYVSSTQYTRLSSVEPNPIPKSPIINCSKPNKKPRTSKDTTPNVGKQRSLGFPVVKPSKPSRKSSRQAQGVVPAQNKVVQNAVMKHTESEANSTAKGSPSSGKRKRAEQSVVIAENTQKTFTKNHDPLSEDELPLKRQKGHTLQSPITKASTTENNRTVAQFLENMVGPTFHETSLLQTNSEHCAQPEIENKPASSSSCLVFNSEVDPLNTPKEDLAEPTHSLRANIRDSDAEITKLFKEEALDTLSWDESGSFPVHDFSFQEHEEEIDPLFPDDLTKESEQFTYPDEHPDNHCRFPRPPLRKLPPIWAESRQELCESFDWFRSYQGGVYHAHNMTKGYLLSGFPASRDRFEHGGRLIISHGGGRAESIHCRKGQLEAHPATDQLPQDKSVRALFDNFVNNRPLALVMDDRYALFPYDLRAKNVTYAVLGFYTIAHAWAEYQTSNNENGRVIRYKFAFRWCDDQGPPWWQESNEDGSGSFGSSYDPQEIRPSDDELESEGGITQPQCASCFKTSIQVFSAWTCLNPQCFKFWKSHDGRPLAISMGYNPKFLELGPSPTIPVGFGALEPQSALELSLPQMNTVYPFSRGFHCPNCGRLSCRDKWEGWQCLNASCKFVLRINRDPRPAQILLYQTLASPFKDYELNPMSDIQQLPPASFKHDKGRGVLQTFIFPYQMAKIHHIKSGNFLGRQEADSIFVDYQVQAASGELKFRRWPMRAHKCRGSLLTNYFSQNTGEPYKYVGGDENTVPFERAPEAVVKARDFLQRRVSQAIGTPVQFNEVLSAAYMERQRMAFHSDDEVGLGPLVAGLSLGSPALMHFRLHAKHDITREKRGILLSIVLRHGDILVMDGAAVQEYYEHTVVPTNFRIAATARYIGAEHV